MKLDVCWDAINQPLHQSIFILVDPPTEASVDQLLLFDCIDEVLSDTLEGPFGYCCRLLSFSGLNL